MAIQFNNICGNELDAQVKDCANPSEERVALAQQYSTVEKLTSFLGLAPLGIKLIADASDYCSNGRWLMQGACLQLEGECLDVLAARGVIDDSVTYNASHLSEVLDHAAAYVAETAHTRMESDWVDDTYYDNTTGNLRCQASFFHMGPVGGPTHKVLLELEVYDESSQLLYSGLLSGIDAEEQGFTAEQAIDYCLDNTTYVEPIHNSQDWADEYAEKQALENQVSKVDLDERRVEKSFVATR